MRFVAGLAVLTAVGTLPAAAQDAPSRVNWFLKGLHTGVCVDFLVSPAAVRLHLGGSAALTPIESVADRYPALARVASAETAYHGWAPAQYCWYLYREAVIRGRQVLVDHGRQPVAVGYLAVAASGLPDSSDAIVLSLFTNSGSLASVAAGARFKVEEIDLTIGLIPGAEDSPDERRFLARHGRTSVQWDGHPGASRPPESRSIQLTGAMVGNGYFPIAAAFEADSAFVASGNLGVTGQGELYALLASSPIRLLTSYLRGGDADWVLGQ